MRAGTRVALVQSLLSVAFGQSLLSVALIVFLVHECSSYIPAHTAFAARTDPGEPLAFAWASLLLARSFTPASSAVQRLSKYKLTASCNLPISTSGFGRLSCSRARFTWQSHKRSLSSILGKCQQ